MSGQRAPTRPNQSPRPTYNPQDYANPGSPPIQYSPQQYSPQHPPPLPPPPRDYRPYNPQAYQDNSIANAANQMYGPASSGGAAYNNAAGFSPYQHQHSPSLPQPQAYSPRSPSSLYSSQMSPDPSAYRAHSYSASVPHNGSSPDPHNRPSPNVGYYPNDPPYPQHSTIPANTLPPPPLPPQHSSPSPDFITHEYGNSRGGNNADVVNPSSPFPRPPLSGARPAVPEDPRYDSRTSRSRPLPGVPQRAHTFFEEDELSHEQGGCDDAHYDEQAVQQDLFDQVESALNIGNFAAAPPPPPPGHRRTSSQYPDDPPRSATFGTYFNEYGEEDSDTEAAAGLAAMRMAEHQEVVENHRRQTLTAEQRAQADAQLQSDPRLASSAEDEGSDEDYHNFDMGALGGGFDVGMSYGTGPSVNLSTTQELRNSLSNQHPSVSSRGTATTASTDHSGSTLHTDTLTVMTSLTTPANRASARVDESGTGGLSDPLPPRRQMSFDADDVSEQQYLDQQDTYPIPETYYPPPHQVGPRPLPSLPLQKSQYTGQGEPLYVSPQLDSHLAPPQAPQQPPPQSPTLNQTNQLSSTDPAAAGFLPRSHSLGYHSTASQQAQPPVRAKTDAEETKRILNQRSQNASQSSFNGFVASQGLDLPSLPTGRRLQPAKILDAQYEHCKEPWALSSITEWLRSLADGDAELRRAQLQETLVNLFTRKVPNMNIAMAESLSVHVVDEMLASGSLVTDEEWLRFGPETTSGVLFQLTNRGCYAQAVHDGESDTVGRCYSHFCQRTERKIITQSDKAHRDMDWVTFHGLKKEDLEGKDRKEIELQNNLHEIIQAEYRYMDDLNVLKKLYRDGLQKKKDVMNPHAIGGFITNVFGKLDAVQKANEDYLLPQLKYRQREQGPWIVGFSDIFRDWIRKAKPAYIDYTANFPNAEFLIRQEERKNVLFHTFLDDQRNNPISSRLAWDNYLKAPITKIQRYSLLLQTVLKNMKQESEEKTNLQTAITEIQEATKECNARLAEESRKVDLWDLKAKLHLRPEMKHVELNLTQWGRELIHSGDLQRTGSSRFTWLETHAILLDNYLVLAKTVSNRDTRADMYDVSKMPIPMDLLVLESADDDAIVKSTMKGIAVGTATSRAPAPVETRLARTNTAQTGKPSTPLSATTGSLSPAPTMSSSSTMVASTVLEPVSRDENVLYPFRVRHLGKEFYTLYAASAGARKEWADKIIEAKTRHAASLFSQNAEPFRLKVIADTAFAYDQAAQPQKSVTIKGTPLSRAVDEVERTYAAAGRPAPVCRARVNCATSFKQADGRAMTAIGTDYGVYLSEAGNPRGWTRAIPALRVAQIAVLEEFGLLLLIADKSLVAYHLDVVTSGPTSSSDSLKKAPQKLSGAKDVGFFAVGRMKDRTLVFYEKRDGRSSVFKILEPVFRKATPAPRSRPFGFKGATDFFRDYDDFYIPADCTALDLFSTSLAVATARGFEILNLDKKTPWSVPDLRPPHVATIAQRLHGLEPVAMLRLAADGAELLCVYEECAVYVNKYGDVSRSVVMEFVGRARNAALVQGYLVLFDADFVEVRDALNGRLKQVVAGRDVRCLDAARGQAGVVPPGPAGAKSVKFALQHPEVERAQLVVELVLNETRRG